MKDASGGFEGRELRLTSQQGSIRWDEEAIAEHDLLRGTRMVIDEPDTPFHSPPKEMEADANDRVGSLDLSALVAELEAVAVSDAAPPDRKWAGTGGGDGGNGGGGFEQRRAEHYGNAHAKMLEARQLMLMEADCGDGDEAAED